MFQFMMINEPLANPTAALSYGYVWLYCRQHNSEANIKNEFDGPSAARSGVANKHGAPGRNPIRSSLCGGPIAILAPGCWGLRSVTTLHGSGRGELPVCVPPAASPGHAPMRQWAGLCPVTGLGLVPPSSSLWVSTERRLGICKAQRGQLNPWSRLAHHRNEESQLSSQQA